MNRSKAVATIEQAARNLMVLGHTTLASEVFDAIIELSQRDTVDDVAAFHDAFGILTPTAPVIPFRDRRELRLRLLREELQELDYAFLAEDIVAVLDALTDLQVVLDGTYLECGLAAYKQAAFNEVHQSNMSKLAEDDAPILREDGKVLKGPKYRPPDLRKVLGFGPE